ncbi:NAD(P)/FAD-dependent oxidoreductase [Martelella alba]|uniref:FAD-binding oxidoreductase n=1 Tax=Martelella alba TaxID=2590451 RepID=A0ABY2SU39_9HYPH|nr:FAD-dependent oxidoreductase [Martelella alba]TKI07859.1 FAD-binding oxidoreductase [Martelella alba]
MKPVGASDVLIIGGGIVGACCAWTLAQRGLRVTVMDAGLRAATAAGMGHLLILDGNPAELALTRYALRRWKHIAAHLPPTAAYRKNGTLWLAANQEEMAEAERKHHLLREQGETCRLLTGAQLTAAEPWLREGLTGGLLIEDDGIVYAPAVARWMLASAGAAQVSGTVSAIDGTRVILEDGRCLAADHLILANGIQAPMLFPELPIEPKKGHLVITERCRHPIKHTLVELGYVTSAHHTAGPSAACNIQPRPTGQIFIGATRQFGNTDPAVESWMLSKMLRRACEYVPALARLTVIRAWTGFRAATPDGLPIIGRHPRHSAVWLAVGHEGLGVTTATATADLLCAAICGERPPLADAPYRVERFLKGA